MRPRSTKALAEGKNQKKSGVWRRKTSSQRRVRAGRSGQGGEGARGP